MSNTPEIALSGLVSGLRPEVAEFAVSLELKLRKNDHKRSWKEQPVEAHVKLLQIELMEFQVAREFFGVAEQCGELLDIAAFALIIRDKLRTGSIPSTNTSREVFRQALADAGHSEATVFSHWALEAYDKAHCPELRRITSAEIASEEP